MGEEAAREGLALQQLAAFFVGLNVERTLELASDAVANSRADSVRVDA